MSSDRDGLPTSAETTTSSTPDVIEDAAARLLTLLRELLLEIRQSERAVEGLSLDSHVDRDLALDSLARTELLQRIEKAFQVRLDEQVLTVETLRDLLALIQQARGEPMKVVTVVEPQTATLGRSTASAPARATTLPEVLDWHSEAHPDRVAIQIYGAHDQIDHTFTYASLRQGARAVATGLQARGLQPGQTVAIMLPTGSEYFLSFFGILLAGGIPVPIYPPVRPSQIEEHLRRHARLLRNAESVVLITVPEAKLVARLLQAQVEHLRHVVTADELAQEPASWSDAAIKTTDLAFLQYTSGSTGDPKGVMLTHANLLANLRAMGPRVGANSN
ncbi:MAG: AMP-binding protein, partial [Candidatus Competibacteraceae bacterium]|nr:AMP-binding protein [Candidatus Competibacteraceae bacterium]